MAPSNKKIEQNELMIVNDSPGEECRIAIVRDGTGRSGDAAVLPSGHLEELYSERTATATNVGNIYKGRVTNVESAIQAAFIDYGQGINGFLHISDLHPKYFPGKERTERVGKKIPRRHRPPIQEALKRGDEVLVQVLKEGIGTKGPTLTSYLSIPGRLLVCMPDMDRVGVSRKVEDEEKRREMRKVLDSLNLPDGFGFILRTAGFGQPKTELKRDAAYLMRLWKMMEKRIKSIKGPCELYTESDLLIRTTRDVLRPSIKAIVVDSESAHRRVSDFLRVVAPRSSPKVIRYHSPNPIFHAFDIERQIELIHSREVPLVSGGRLVIDQTEALVAIDVNSAKSRAARDSETNAYNTNCEAVDEICRQLRLRDLGGLIINDLIDMRATKHRRAIEERFTENLKRDRARSTILPISEFGLVEMTRQRMRPSMRKSHFIPCSHCDGHGEIKSPDSVGADAARHIGYLLQFERVKRVEVVCSPRVASVMLSAKRRELVRLEDATQKKVDVRVSDAIAVDRVDYYAYDDRNADIDVEKLTPPHIPTVKELEAAAKREPDEKGAKAPATSKADTEKKPVAGPASFDRAAGDADAESETPAKRDGAKKKRPRRRRQKAKPDQQPIAASAETDKSESADPVRVFALAKELGVKSKEIVERCKEEPDIDVKNHMSSVLGRAVAKIRSWFDSDEAPTETPGLMTEGKEGTPGLTTEGRKTRMDSKETPAPDSTPIKRKRRRRGGQKERAKKAAKAAKESAKAQPSAPTPHSNGSVAETKTEAVSNKKDSDSTSASEPKSKRPRRRSRSRKPSDKPAAKTEPQAKESKAEPQAAPEVVTAGGSALPARKPRRSLYRNRSKLTAVELAKRAAENEE